MRPALVTHFSCDDGRMMAVHTQSATQYGLLAGLAVNDNVITKRSYCSQVDFKKCDAVGLGIAQPNGRTREVNLLSNWVVR